MLKIVIYHKNYAINIGSNPKKQKPSKKIDPIHRSVRRTRTTIKDITLSNRFQLWCTFTFNPDKHDRYDINHCKVVMRNWLHAQKKHSPELKYLIVPEHHKDGALHFHALISNFNGRLAYTKVRQNGRIVFNLSGYRSGFSTAVPIGSYRHKNVTGMPSHLIPPTLLQDTDPEDYAKLSNYLQKYITKDMPLLEGKKRYWSSRNLQRPITHVNGITKLGLSRTVRNNPYDYVTESYEVQTFSKTPVRFDSDRNVKILDVQPISSIDQPALLDDFH